MDSSRAVGSTGSPSLCRGLFLMTFNEGSVLMGWFGVTGGGKAIASVDQPKSVKPTLRGLVIRGHFGCVLSSGNMITPPCVIAPLLSL